MLLSLAVDSVATCKYIQHGEMNYVLPRNLHKTSLFEFFFFLFLWNYSVWSRSVAIPLNWSWRVVLALILVISNHIIVVNRKEISSGYGFEPKGSSCSSVLSNF